MATSDLGQQVAIQKAINDLMSERTKILDEQLKSLSKQNELIDSMKNSMDKGVKQAAGSTKNLADVTQAASEAADKAKNSQEGFNIALQEGKKDTDGLSSAMETAAKVGATFGDAIAGATAGTLGLIKAAGNLVGSLFNIGVSIASIPIKLWDAFVDKSMNMPYNPAFLQELEEIRKTFGDLSSGTGKQVIDMYKQLRHSQDEATAAGLRLQRVFGYGVEGRAAMLKFMGEMAKGLGPQMNEIVTQLGQNILEVTYAIKGMGLSSEEAGNAMKFFYHSGKDAGKMMIEMGTTAAMMAKQTGFNIKTLSKSMVETIQVFPQFAKHGVQAMAKVAHYTHSLGIEVKDLQGVFDKFDSFDQAAESASQLSQAFGVNIDAMRMVKEQDPTKRLEQLRNAFKAAGKDINSMTSAERKLAEATTGLTGSAFEAAMGEGNKKKALTESEKASQAATRAAKEQAAAMKQLAKSIERIIPPQGERFKGFFDAFEKGFSKGMFYSNNMRQMMMNLNMTFRQAYYFGMRLARLILRNFPGMTELTKGFTKLFDPVTFRKFFNETLEAFREFFDTLEKNPSVSFDKFIDRVKLSIEKNFGGDSTNSALGSLRRGIDKILSLLSVVGAKAIKMLMESTTEGIKNFTSLLRDPDKITDTAGTATGFVSKLFSPIWKAIRDSWPEMKIALVGPAGGWPPGGLLGEVWKTIKEPLWTFAKYLGVFFAGKLALGFGMGIATEFAKDKIMSMLMGTGGGGSAGLMSKLGTVLMNVFRAGLPFLKGLISKLPIIGIITGAIVGIFDAWSFGDTPEDKEMMKVGMDKWGAFINGMVKVMSVGLFDIRGSVEKTIKEIKELVSKTAIAQANAFKEGAEEARTTSEGLMEQAIKAGNRDEALAYFAQSELQNAIARGELDASKMTGEEWLAATKKYKNEMKEKLKPQLEQKFKEMAEKVAKETADKNESEKLMKIEKARTLVEQVKDVGELQSQLDQALKGLDAALVAGNFENKIRNFGDKVGKIYPIIESVAKNIAAARETAAVTMTGKTDPLETLSDSLKSASGLSDGLIKLNDIPAGTADKLAGLVVGLSTALSSIDLTKLSAIGLDIEAFAEKIANADGKLRESLKPGEGLVKVVKDLGKLGKIDVTHNIPGVQMNVHVSLDSKELAKSIVNVDVSKDVNKPQRFTIGKRNEDKTVGV